MFHDRGYNTRINKIHERALRFVYKDDISTFEQLLVRDSDVSVHHRNIHAIAIEMYKSLNGIQLDVFDDIFVKKSDLNLRSTRSHNEFYLGQANTVHYGHDSLKYFGPKIWEFMPIHIKLSKSLIDFKLNVKKWTPSECPCRLCKEYIGGVGYINITN